MLTRLIRLRMSVLNRRDVVMFLLDAFSQHNEDWPSRSM